jgi:hypothetical protein
LRSRGFNTSPQRQLRQMIHSAEFCRVIS